MLPQNPLPSHVSSPYSNFPSHAAFFKHFAKYALHSYTLKYKLPLNCMLLVCILSKVIQTRYCGQDNKYSLSSFWCCYSLLRMTVSIFLPFVIFRPIELIQPTLLFSEVFISSLEIEGHVCMDDRFAYVFPIRFLNCSVGEEGTFVIFFCLLLQGNCLFILSVVQLIIHTFT